MSFRWNGLADRRVTPKTVAVVQPGFERRALFQDGVGIDRLALPPLPLRRHLEDGEMEVRGILGRVPGGADVTDDLSPPHGLALVQTGGVAIEVCVIVRVRFRR